MEVIMTTKEDLVALAVEAATIALSKMDEKKSSHIKTEESPTLIRGIQGLANFLGVSQPTAQRLKNAKLFPCIQHGRTIFFKPDEVLDGMAKRKSKY